MPADAQLKTQRIRGRKLQELRRAFFEANPLCASCQKKGLVSLASDLDHVIPLYKGGSNRRENLQGLCSDCHKEKTRVDIGAKDRPEFDSNGRIIW